MEVANQHLKKREIDLLIKDLTQFESYIRAFWKFLPIPVCYVNPAFNILDLSQSFEDLSGFHRLEIVGESLKRVFADFKEIKRIKSELIGQSGIVNKETLFLTKKNKRVPVSLWAMPSKDREGNIVGYFFAFLDITERRRLEKDLREKIRDEKEARFLATEERDKTLAIITNFADGLLVFDKENKLSLMNPRAENFFKIREETVINKSLLELAQISRIQVLSRLLGKRFKKLFRKELVIDESLILEVSTIPIIRAKERLGILVILHDITREKIVEKMKTEFVSLAAHQLRTPLSAIKWSLGMILEGNLGDITKKQYSFIKKTYLSNERMISLVNDLLNVSRIEEGKYIYRSTAIQIENLVQRVINLHRQEIQRKNLKLKFKRPSCKLPRVKVDAEKIKLAVQNLLDNAVRYTPKGGSITVSLKKLNKKEIEFSIKDTGIGIPAGQKKQVFIKFFRGSNALRMETEGSGLGLFMTKDIIENHQGKIWFKSQEGRGATFYFTLPIKT